MSLTQSLTAVARLADPHDNVAIATRTLPAATRLSYQGQLLQLNATVLEGHRFAIRSIASGEALLSWGLPFGYAISDIEAGHYVANASMLETLRARQIQLTLPDSANFADSITPFELDESSFEAAEQVSPYNDSLYFEGFVRPGERGTGTRNYIVLLGTSSLSGAYVKALESRFKAISERYPNISGVVAVAHTEGATPHPNNYDLVLRTLAGFVVHPNVAAVLCVDHGNESVNNRVLKDYLLRHSYPLEAVTHAFLSLAAQPGDFKSQLDTGETVVRNWLEPANTCKREHVSIANLKLALQCGGSDAFSGISGNPLAAWVAKELIRYGGAANLAETDELIGAESYVLQRVKSLKVARQFLATIARFKARAAWHGTSAEGNPSGGNKFRGLYNIVLKSIGAANKKHPEVRLDSVIEYGEKMPDAAYTFMDSPGNDLESIAGQVASGCTMIFFVTGNGSITNFPFVPTIKIVTTSERFELLATDMDVNAGAYLDGHSMEALGQTTLARLIEVASGQPSVGEKSGQSQVQLWRNWQQTNPQALAHLLNSTPPSGEPIPLAASTPSELRFARHIVRGRHSLGLLLPTSLCSGQVAQQIAEQFNEQGLGRDNGIHRFVALSHTEGCGVSSGHTATLQTETLLNYLRHPFVKRALLLEHGCEITHNDHMRARLQTLGLQADQFGWASIQLDGGTEQVSYKVRDWFSTALNKRVAQINPSPVRLGVITSGKVSAELARALASLCQRVAAAGGTVVVVEGTLSQQPAFLAQLEQKTLTASLEYGQYALTAGLHLMRCPTQHWVEKLTGLGATGVETVLAHVADHPQQRHPFIPVIQVSSEPQVAQNHLDGFIAADDLSVARLLGCLDESLATRVRYDISTPNSDFQMTRGLLGISM